MSSKSQERIFYGEEIVYSHFKIPIVLWAY